MTPGGAGDFAQAIGDCVYTPNEHLVPIFRGNMAKISRNDNLNFFASQLRIRIEMTFGLMVKNWGILSRPLDIRVWNEPCEATNCGNWSFTQFLH